ncbi:MAG TPA: metalloprotease, partial [Firmicutes bacterium]|nr:metalloprotease [Bacillota bacterium]
ADYLAGVWAHYAARSNLLDEGDIEEALNAASMIGDDRIQKDTWGYVVPDRFTHGTSEQRARWFMRGYKFGTIADGDTFNAPEL